MGNFSTQDLKDELDSMPSAEEIEGQESKVEDSVEEANQVLPDVTDEESTNVEEDSVEEEVVEESSEEEVEQPKEKLYDIPVDGKTEQKTLAELKQGFSGQAKVTQGLQQNAATQKTLQGQMVQIQSMVKDPRKLGQYLRKQGYNQNNVMALFDTGQLEYKEFTVDEYAPDESKQLTKQFNQFGKGMTAELNRLRQGQEQQDRVLTKQELKENFQGFEKEFNNLTSEKGEFNYIDPRGLSVVDALQAGIGMRYPGREYSVKDALQDIVDTVGFQDKVAIVEADKKAYETLKAKILNEEKEETQERIVDNNVPSAKSGKPGKVPKKKKNKIPENSDIGMSELFQQIDEFGVKGAGSKY